MKVSDDVTRESLEEMKCCHYLVAMNGTSYNNNNNDDDDTTLLR